MENFLFSSYKKAVKNWWVSLVIGIIAVILGIICMFTPLATFATLSFLFVIAFLIGGISEIAFALTNRESLSNWGWTLAIGIIDIIFAIILLANPMLAPLMLCYLIACWILIQSIWGIGMSIDLKDVPESGWGWLLALSLLGVLASILLLLQPAIVGLFAAYFVAFGFLAFGVLRIYMAFRLRSCKKYFTDDK